MGRGLTWAVLHLRGPPSFSRLRLVRELEDTPGNVSGQARAASGNLFARCVVREILGFQILEQKSAVSFVSIELVRMAEEAFTSGTDSSSVVCLQWVHLCAACAA